MSTLGPFLNRLSSSRGAPLSGVQYHSSEKRMKLANEKIMDNKMGRWISLMLCPWMIHNQEGDGEAQEALCQIDPKTKTRKIPKIAKNYRARNNGLYVVGRMLQAS